MNKAGVILLFLAVLLSSCIVGVVLYRYYMVESSQYVAPPRDDLIAEMLSRINETEIYNTVYRLQTSLREHMDTLEMRKQPTISMIGLRTYLDSLLNIMEATGM